MIWLLLLVTATSAFCVFESLFEIVGAMLFLLHNAVEALAGKQAAAVVTLIVLGVGGVYVASYFNAPPEHRGRYR